MSDHIGGVADVYDAMGERAPSKDTPMTTKESEVDVLAVMDAEVVTMRRLECWVNEALTPTKLTADDAIARMEQARAAVAEVFEASADLEKAVREETEHLKASAFRDISECDKHRTFENRVMEATDRLRTALRNAGVKS